jgi:hypothetical protein
MLHHEDIQRGFELCVLSGINRSLPPASHVLAMQPAFAWPTKLWREKPNAPGEEMVRCTCLHQQSPCHARDMAASAEAANASVVSGDVATASSPTFEPPCAATLPKFEPKAGMRRPRCSSQECDSSWAKWPETTLRGSDAGPSPGWYTTSMIQRHQDSSITKRVLGLCAQPCLHWCRRGGGWN